MVNQSNIKRFGFHKPMILDNLSWQSNLFVEIGNFIVSFTGDDGVTGGKNNTSKRHYFGIWKTPNSKVYDKNNSIEVTAQMGYDNFGNNIVDFINAIIEINEIICKKIN